MGLEIVGPTGRHGKVIVSDEREDGTLVLLVCEEYPGSGGTLVRPEDDEPDSDDGGLPWPTTAQRQLSGTLAFRPPFEFTLNVEGMPPGINRFSFDRLLTAVESAVESGVDEVTVRPENAALWGWLGPAASVT
jgi:hypothetical protein